MPELLGNVLLESMACGTPVICSDVGGMPEVVEDGLTGFVVPPNEPDALHRRIGELAGDQRLCREMGRRSRERVLERFTWERAAAARSRPTEKAGPPPTPKHTGIEARPGPIVCRGADYELGLP